MSPHGIGLEDGVSLERDASHGWDRLSTLREAVPARLGRGSTPRTLIGLALVHVVAVTIVAASGDLHIDDIRAQAYAAGRTLWPFVIESNATHLAPGARLIDWVMATHWPLQHWPWPCWPGCLCCTPGQTSWCRWPTRCGPAFETVRLDCALVACAGAWRRRFGRSLRVGSPFGLVCTARPPGHRA